jgi:hypothetical protein
MESSPREQPAKEVHQERESETDDDALEGVTGGDQDIGKGAVED